MSPQVRVRGLPFLPHVHLVDEVELEERVCDARARVSAEHEHGVSRHRHREVAAGGRTLALLPHLLPDVRVALSADTHRAVTAESHGAASEDGQARHRERGKDGT